MIDSDDKIIKEPDNISSSDNNIISNNIDTVPSSDVSFDILKSMLSFINIDFHTLEELIGIEIDRDCFLETAIIQKFKEYQSKLKNAGYSSGKLTSLHKNNIVKQQFPAINMLRQILKCNNLWLRPINKSFGYNKNIGSKIVKRSFIISKPKKKEIEVSIQI